MTLWCKEASVYHILTVMCALNQCTLELSTRKDANAWIASQPLCSVLPSPSINYNLHLYSPDSVLDLNVIEKNLCKKFPTKLPVFPFGGKNLKNAMSW